MKDHNGALVAGKIQARKMFAKIGLPTAPDLVWADDNVGTAYTDGKTYIAIPRRFQNVRFNGKRLSKRAKLMLEGLIAHEVCHFLQPVRAIHKVEKQTGLHPSVRNVINDINGERVIERLFPKYKKSLTYLRRSTWRFRSKKWVATQKLRVKFAKAGKIDTTTTDAFLSEASYLLMLARFATPTRPYARRAANLASTQRGRYFVRTGGLIAALEDIPQSPRDLPDFIARVARDYPELCSQQLDLSELQEILDLLGSTSSVMDWINQQADQDGDQDGANNDNDNDEQKSGDQDGDQDNDEDNELQPPDELPINVADLIDESMRVATLQGKKARRLPPTRGASVLAQRLRVRLAKDKTTFKVVAPVNMNRRQIATGEIQPWSMDLSKGKAIGRKLTLAVDHSDSMIPVSRIVNEAAQAIALAVKADGGEVGALIFGTDPFVSIDDDDLPLFTEWRNLGNTSFEFLNYLWLKQPDNTVIVITDGDGWLPNPIRAKDKARTHIIMIGDRCNPDAAAMMGHVHECQDLKDLPGILVDISNSVRNS